MNKEYYRIEDVAKKTGLTKRALRYYEDMKLISPSRTDAGYRLYTDEDVEDVIKIVELRESLGFSLNAIKEIVDLQKMLKGILKEGDNDSEHLSKSIIDIKKQIALIENKEKTLENVKVKYEDILHKLLEIEEQIK